MRPVTDLRKVLHCLFAAGAAAIALAPSASAAPSTTTTSPSVFSLPDGYVCYRYRDCQPIIPLLTVEDQSETRELRLAHCGRKLLCAPAATKFSEIVDPQTHLLRYRVPTTVEGNLPPQKIGRAHV